MRASLLLPLGLVAAQGPPPQLLAELSTLPCRGELFGLGLGLAGLQGCLAANSTSCSAKAYALLDATGQLVGKKECADGLTQFLTKNVVRIDMDPIYKVIANASACAKSAPLSDCQAGAWPALSRVGSAFVSELLGDVPTSFRVLLLGTWASARRLVRCVANVPTLKASLGQEDYAASAVLLQPYADGYNKMRAGPWVGGKGADWLVQRMAELLLSAGPMTMRQLPTASVDTLPDLRTCSKEVVWAVGNVTGLVLANEGSAFHQRLFVRLPILQAIHPWYQAFFDSDRDIVKLASALPCIGTWATPTNLQTCLQRLGPVVSSYVLGLQAAANEVARQELLQQPTQHDQVQPPPAPAPANQLQTQGAGRRPGLARFFTVLFAGAVAVLLVGTALLAYRTKIKVGLLLAGRQRGFQAVGQEEVVGEVEAQSLMDTDSDSEGEE